MTPDARRGEAPLLLLLELLQRGRLTTRESCDVLGVEPDDTGKKKARRAIARLRELAPVSCHGSGRDTFYALDPIDHVGTLTTMDRVALIVGRDAVSFLQGTLLAEGLDKAVGEPDRAGPLLKNLPRKVVHRAEPEPTYSDHRETLDGVLDGLARERVISFTNGPGRVAEDFQPLSLVVYRRALYIMGRFTGSPKAYRYRIDRLSDVNVGRPFDYPDDWNPDEELTPWFGLVAKGQPETVVLRFSAAVAPLVRERCWHPTATVRSLHDGRVQLEMFTAGPELERFILEWGPHCEVLSPPALRAKVRASLEQTLDLYRTPDGK